MNSWARPKCLKCSEELFPLPGYMMIAQADTPGHWDKCFNCKGMQQFIDKPMFENTLINWILLPRLMLRQFRLIKEYKAILNR